MPSLTWLAQKPLSSPLQNSVFDLPVFKIKSTPRTLRLQDSQWSTKVKLKASTVFYDLSSITGNFSTQSTSWRQCRQFSAAAKTNSEWPMWVNQISTQIIWDNWKLKSKLLGQLLHDQVRSFSQNPVYIPTATPSQTHIRIMECEDAELTSWPDAGLIASFNFQLNMATLAVITV